MHRVLVVVGTRPEAIKMAPVIEALRAHELLVEPVLALTGQHDELVDQVLSVFGLEASHDLAIMKEGQTLYHVVHAALDGLRAVVREVEPDVLLVEGDTATVFVGALVGFFEGVQVGHVEAGLRTGRKRSPFPEEVLRRLTDVIADYHFAPTPRAARALAAEGIPPDRVHVTGNTVVDAVLRVAEHDRPVRDPVLRDVLAGPGRLVLVTVHRRESFGEPIREIFRGLLDLVHAVEDIEIVYPVHPNPNVTEPARDLLAGHPRIHLTAPVDYLDLVTAVRSAALILTDSGGIQEEAPAFGTPVLVLRDVTERPEALEAGVAELIGTRRARIAGRGKEVLEGGWAPPGDGRQNPFGDGHAAERIADILVSRLTGRLRATEDWDPSR